MATKQPTYLEPGEKTELGAYYHVCDLDRRDRDGNGGWYGTRRNGDKYCKLWMPNSDEYEGGPRLDAALAKKPSLRAVKAKESRE